MFGFNFPGMEQFQQNMPNQQQMSANNVRATPTSTPSMGQLQQGMGGLLTNDTQQNAFNGFMGGLMGSFAPVLNGMVNSGYQALGMEPPAQPVFAVPEKPTYEVQPPKDPVVQDDGWGGVKTDYDAINYALQKGDISPDEARWLVKWQGEANDGNNWVDGSGGTKNWDYMNSGLTDRNKGIVDKFYKSVSGNWGGSGAQQGQQAGGLKGLLDVEGGVLDGIEKAKGNIKAIRGLLG
jgi:hypothetical protein